MFSKKLNVLGSKCTGGTLMLVATVFLAIGAPAAADLAGFEDANGYFTFNTRNVDLGVVNHFNAGQYGAANGGPGGSSTSITQDTGLWNDLLHDNTDYGDSFRDGRYYIARHPENNNFKPRTGDGFLVINNGLGNDPALDPFLGEDLSFSYTIDERDYYNGGSPIDPLTTSNHEIEWSIWACAEQGQTGVDDQFFWTFRDDNGNVAGQVGWTDNSPNLIYRSLETDAWTDTGFGLNTENYDQLTMTFDTANDTWSLSYFDADDALGLTGTSVDVFSDIAMGMSIDNLSRIDWTARDGTSKSSFDDSVFTITASVPEPSSLILFGFGGVALTLRRRRK